MPIDRRSFFKTCGVGLACLGTGVHSSVAVDAFQRPGKPRLMLSLAAYSFRQYFSDGQGGRKPGPNGSPINLIQFIDYCADHGCDGAELTSYYFPQNLTDEYLIQLRRHAFLRGVAISGTSVGNNFALPKGEKRDAQIAMVKKWIGHAAVLGAPHIRIFAGPAAKDQSKEEAKKLCIEAIEECSEAAGKHGIFLGLENHGGIVAEPDDLLDIVKTVKSPWLAINLDSGNFQTADPYADLAKCAPYTVNAQIKVEIRPRGQKVQKSDLGRVVKLLRDANYQGFVALEYEAAEDAWKAVPEWLAAMKREFAA